jgi:hypothetical protein
MGSLPRTSQLTWHVLLPMVVTDALAQCTKYALIFDLILGQ